MGQILRTPLDLLHPDTAQKVHNSQLQRELIASLWYKKSCSLEITMGMSGSEISGPLSIHVITDKGVHVALHWHIDHLRIHHSDSAYQSPEEAGDDWVMMSTSLGTDISLPSLLWFR